jgi:hypothetical protein
MNIENIKEYLDNQFPLTSGNLVWEIEGNIIINGYCYMPIKLSPQYDESTVINVLNEDSTIIGEIIFNDKDNPIEVQGLPELNYSCLLIEIQDDVITDSYYTFKYDFIKIKEDFLLEYILEYKECSSIWGGFLHVENLMNNTFEEKLSLNAIKVSKCNIPSVDILESLEQIILDTNPFNRFLKLYHLIELQFDMHTAELIKNMFDQGGKEKEISEALRDYVRDDIERLKSLFKLRIDKQSMLPYINSLINYKTEAKSIFYYKEKDSNPLRSVQKFENLLNSSNITEQSFNQIFGTNWYEDKILPSIAYWIYRVRNCIAHNKIGEYVMKKSDESFVVNFAEPLLKEVVKQCYKK